MPDVVGKASSDTNYSGYDDEGGEGLKKKNIEANRRNFLFADPPDYAGPLDKDLRIIKPKTDLVLYVRVLAVRSGRIGHFVLVVPIASL